MNSQQQPGYGGFAQPGYPPQGGYPQGGGYPPPQAGGYPPPGFQQGGYPGPPPTGFVNPGYPDPNQGGYIPPGGGGGYPPPPMGGNYGGPGAPPPTYLPNNAGGELGEDQSIKGFDFNDKSIRMAFIRKVYGILMCQLVVTFGFIAVCLLHEPTKRYVRSHPALWWIALVVMLVTLISMACCTTVRRKAPMNFIFLTLFTLAESFMLAMAASSFNSQEVLLAVGITAVVCLALTLFAFQTRWDFTKLGGVLLVLLVVLMLFGIISMFYRGKTITLVYASLGAILFSFYLIYDTQLMMGGNHKFSISPEEYIFAALNLYLDVINIFLYILTIIGASRD